MSQQNAKLSRNVLKMKFMKKSKEKFENEIQEEERKALFDVTDPRRGDGFQCIIEPSFVSCQKLVFGRFSYRGMNPEIERLMKERELKNLAKYCGMDGISNKEMAARYTSLMSTMGNKFRTKRKRIDVEGEDDRADDICVIPSYQTLSQANERKFLKPQDN